MAILGMTSSSTDLAITRRGILKWSIGTALATVLHTPLAGANGEGRIAVVVARNSPIQELSEFKLKKLYLGAHIIDPSGERIIPLNHLAESPDRVAFDQMALGMAPDEAARYWIDRMIRGESGAPKALGSPQLVQQTVSKAVHSIAYVRLDQVSDELRVIATLESNSPVGSTRYVPAWAQRDLLYHVGG